jgi:amino acid transporter
MPESPSDGGGGAPENADQASKGATPLVPDLALREVRKGRRPGDRYVRVTPRSRQPFRPVREGEYVATELAIRPRSLFESLLTGAKRVGLGAPLATSRLMEQRLGKVQALAVMASDNLSSSAYATEEILRVLLLAGTGALTASLPIAATIAALVVVVAISYTQVIRAYPGGGGSYVVAKQNLGALAGRVAGASLIVDYTLTVAVSTAAGVAAITSAIPEAHAYRVPLAVALVAAITWLNLRGVRESARVLAVPTYVFILSFVALLATGFVRMGLGHDLSASPGPNPLQEGGHMLGLFLILRAFSSGAAALTGIEAVSNGVPSFKPPEARNASITLAWMAGILVVFFLGLTALAHQLEVAPSETKTVVAQVAESVFGKTPLFYIVQFATMMILVLAANTSFAGLPRLASVLARDRELPRQFAFRGDRLVFSHGIIALGLASAVLLVIFKAETHSLIPLYAVGVFVAFTLSQAGLVVHWHRDGSPGAHASLLVNAVGAIATGIVAAVIAVTKFTSGAWISILAIALVALLLDRVNQHYKRVTEQLAIAPARPRPRRPEEGEEGGKLVVVPVDEVNEAALRAVEFALAISDRVTAVHISDDIAEGEGTQARWRELVPDVPLVIIESPYRSFVAPILTYIDAVDHTRPGADITVVLPEFVPAHFWEGLLHNQSALRLKNALLNRPNTVIVNVRYHLHP